MFERIPPSMYWILMGLVGLVKCITLHFWRRKVICHVLSHIARLSRSFYIMASIQYISGCHLAYLLPAHGQMLKVVSHMSGDYKSHVDSLWYYAWFIMRLTIMCSYICEQMPVRKTGLLWLADDVLPFLKIGMIFSDLHFSGNRAIMYWLLEHTLTI